MKYYRRLQRCRSESQHARPVEEVRTQFSLCLNTFIVKFRSPNLPPHDENLRPSSGCAGSLSKHMEQIPKGSTLLRNFHCSEWRKKQYTNSKVNPSIDCQAALSCSHTYYIQRRIRMCLFPLARCPLTSALSDQTLPHGAPFNSQAQYLDRYRLRRPRAMQFETIYSSVGQDVI